MMINGVHWHVESRGDGIPLLLLHGFTGSSRTWDPFLPFWNGRFRTIAVDIVGHGKTDAPGDPSLYTMERTVDDLAAILDRLEVDKAAVLGYSMGGRLALSFAVLRPERVRGLVLESTSPGLKTEEERKARRKQDEELAERIEKNGIEWFVNYWENIPLFRTVKRLPADVQQKIREDRLRQRPEGLANSLRGMGTGAQPSWWDRLETIPAPVLVMAGELDEKFVGIAREMVPRLARATFVAVKDAGHAIHAEQAETFRSVVQDYLETL